MALNTVSHSYSHTINRNHKLWLLKKVVYHRNWKSLKSMLYSSDMLIFFIIAIYLRKGKECLGKVVAALAGPLPGPWCV